MQITSDQVPLTQGEREMRDGFVEDAIAAFRTDWSLSKTRPDWLESWLQAQYCGETNAVASMRSLLSTLQGSRASDRRLRLVERIVRDEERHVAMIGELLRSRGRTPRAPRVPEVLDGMADPVRATAIASRAEAVRAGEVRIVLADADVPVDVRDAFACILRDEAFHERAFRRLAGREAMEQNKQCSHWCQQC